MSSEAGSESRARVNAIAPALAQALESLSNVVKCKESAMFRPVVHYLDWRLRMMPLLAPAAIFRYHAGECRKAAQILAIACKWIKSSAGSMQVGIA